MSLLPADIMTEETLLRSVPAVKIRSQRSVNREQALYDRFKRIQARKAEHHVEYEFTTDPGYLHQYYLLREQMFISSWGLKHFYGQEDKFDARSHILVAREGNQVIGGARLTVKEPGDKGYLPMEDDDFILENILPELNLATQPYLEVSRFALLPEYRGTECTSQIYHGLNKKTLSLGIRYAFAKSPAIQARIYRKDYQALGVDYKIRTDIVIPDKPDYDGIKMALSVLDLAPLKEYYGQV